MKTCSKCGYTTENDLAKFCKQCGANFSDDTTPAMESSATHEQSVSTNQSNYTDIENTLTDTENTLTDTESHEVSVHSYLALEEEEKIDITPEYLKENSTIGGWLTFFLFSICFGGIISAALSLAEINSPVYQNATLLVLADASLGVMTCVLAFYTLYSFIKRKPDAVYLAKLYVVTAFLTNILALFVGDYEATGPGSLTQILGRLVWGIIWYVFLCVSYRVEEVIPKEYREKSAKDYIITGALYIIPIVLLIAGINELQVQEQALTTEPVQELQLGEDQYTDGRIIFKLPEGFTVERNDLEDPKRTLFTLHENEGTGYVYLVCGYDSDLSLEHFNEYCNNWEDYYIKPYKSEVICNETRFVNDLEYWYRVTSYKSDNTIYWRFILLFDGIYGRAAIISAYDSGNDSYLTELLESIRFN